MTNFYKIGVTSFQSKKKQKSILHAMFAFFMFFFAIGLNAQTTLINPATDGGFNSGTTFAANGWTVANEGTGAIKWAIGTAASGFTATASTTASSPIITLTAANTSIAVGQAVYGINIPNGATVASVSGTSVTLSVNATATESNVTLGFSATAGSVNVPGRQLTTASIAANSYGITLASSPTINIAPGMLITPITGIIDANTYVTSVNGTSLRLSKPTLGAATTAQTLNFTSNGVAITGNAAYISNDDGVSNSYSGNSTTRTVYLYRDIVNPPANEKAMTLTFDVKSPVPSSSGWQVWVAPISQTVVGTNTQVTSPFIYGVNWPGATMIAFNAEPQVSATKMTAFIPKQFAGTSFRLIFVWTNSSSNGTLAPVSIDNISLTSRVADEITVAQSGLWTDPTTWDGGKVPTHADTVVVDGTETVIINSRYSGCEDLVLAGTNALVQFAVSSVIDDFTIYNDLNLSATGARFNNYDGGLTPTSPNGKRLKLGHNLDVGAGAIFDSSRDGSFANFAGRLTLNGSTVQTITINPAGFIGGSVAGLNTSSNVVGVLDELEIDNSASVTPNVIWNVNLVRIKSSLNLLSGRINVASNSRFVLGNFGSLSSVIVNPGSGFVGGTVSRWMSSANTRNVQPGTEYPGSDNNFKPYWYPFINATGQERSLYLLPDINATPTGTAGEVGLTYSDANTVTNGLSITDGSYTITDRYNGNWTFSTPDANAIPGGTAVVYNNTGTHRVGVYANGAYEAIDGTSRLMNLSAAAAGVHQEGTALPFVFRKNLTLAHLTAAPLYIGINSASKLNTATAIVSAATGDWNSTTTWVGGVVPTCTDVVTIASGHNVTVTTGASAAGVVILKGGTLTNNGNTTEMTVGCTNNNAAFYNYGTHTMTSGKLKVNGFVAYKSGSFFNQSGGDIIIDSNNNGDAATSVAFGGSSCKIEAANLNLTGGKITIVDPLVNIGAPITTANSIGNFTVNTAGANGTFAINASATGSTISIPSNSNGTHNLFEVGQEVTHANIPAGTTITAISVGFAGFPPAITLTLSNAVTTAIPSGTPISFSAMKNGGSTVVLEGNANNAFLTVGQPVSGPGIQSGSVITEIISGSTNTFVKIKLSQPVSGLTTSPITAPQTLTFTGVVTGSSSVGLSAANTDIIQGLQVSGTGILPGTFVAEVNGSTLTLSQPIQPGAPSPLQLTFTPFNTLSSGSFIYASPNHYAAGLNHTLQIGDGVSTQNSTVITNGFNCQFQAAGGLLSLGNLIVDAPNGNERFMNVSSNGANNAFNMNVQNDLIVTTGSVFKKTFYNSTVYVGGNIINNGTINFPKNGTGLYLGNYINGVAVPTTLSQTISGSGTFATNQWALQSTGFDSASFQSLTVNNTSSAGVTLNVPLRISTGLTMTNGIVNTTATNLLSVGNPDVTSTSGGTLSGGSATSYINGPLAFANNTASNINQFRVMPLGKNGKYLPIAFSATGGVELIGEAFDTNTGTVNTANASNLSQERWKLTRVGTAGDFTGYNVRLGAITITPFSRIVHSATEDGVYDIVSTPASPTMTFAAGTPNTVTLGTAQTGGFLGNFAAACLATTPIVTVSAATCAAAGGATITNYNAALTYTFSPTGPTVGTGGVISGLTAGTAYTVTASDGTCTSVASASFTVAAQLTTPAVPTVTTVAATCTTTGSASVSNYDGAFTYTFTPTGPTVGAGGAINGATFGTSYTVKAGIGTCTSAASSSFTVANQLAPAVPTVTTTTATCAAAGSATVSNYDATLTYVFTPSGPTVGTGGAITGTTAGTSYTITAGNANCTSAASSAFTTAAQLTTPVVPTVTTTAATCAAAGSATVSNYDATLTYVFTPSGPSVGTGGAITGATAGTSYTVTAGNANCTSAASSAFTTAAQLTTPVVPTVTTTAATCAAAGSATVSNYDATLTYVFTPSGPSVGTGGAITGATAGTSYTVTAGNANCTSATSSAFTTAAQLAGASTPTGSSAQTINVGVATEATIEDLIVTGSNGNWYISEANALTNTNPLATGTQLISGTTYYTVNISADGCVSTAFAVTVTVVLSSDTFELNNLKYYPNPVTNQLTITSLDKITKVEIHNILGQLVKVINSNSNEIFVEFGELTSGTYLLKVSSENKSENFKIIKK